MLKKINKSRTLPKEPWATLTPLETWLSAEETEPMQFPIEHIERVLGRGIGVQTVARGALREMFVDLELVAIPVDRCPALTAIPARPIPKIGGVGGDAWLGIVEMGHVVPDEMRICLAQVTGAHLVQDVPEAGLMRP
jgi:hypothetical protein